MPASPGMRCSPGREPRGDKHKRVRSLESGISFKERDDDLALFNEVQTRERDEFLLQANDDFEDTFVSKLRQFSDHKVGINVASRGESSDFLNAEEEKNDYEWLITPPETPLFTSLDDEPPQVTIAQRGRARAQPISLSRSSTMEKSHRSSRGSPSPNRLSPSPRSREPTFQPRSRPSSLPSSSPPPTRRPISRSKRPSSPSSKPSTPPPRASTPTSRRLSTGSVSTTSTSARGISGNSVSPKVRAWQANIPGFSTEAPPNLRTSLADRPASYVRGSSPASRNGRHSMSPIATRSISSSHSQDRDRFNSYSKGSIASSAEDDVESLPSVTVDGSERSSSRKVSGFRNNNNNNNNKAPFSQKPNRTVSSNSAPKRSFDLALRQMDHRKGQHNMFRPLLSSVPTSNYYAGKASPARNSSVTTSSNASSDVNTSGPHDIEVNGPNDDEDDDATSGYVKVPDSNIEDDEVFVFEKSVTPNEEMGNEDGFENLAQHDTGMSVVLDDEDDDATSGYVKVPDCNIEDDEVFVFEKSVSPNEEMGNDGFENPAQHDTATSEVLDDFMEIDSLKDMLLCSRCGLRYSESRQTDDDIKLCQNCRKSALSLTNSQEEFTMSDKDQESVNTAKPQLPLVIDESVELTFMGETQSEQQKDLVEDSEITKTEQSQHISELAQVNHEVISQPSSNYSDAGSEPFQRTNDFSKVKVDSLQGEGISVVLKRSSSIKRPLIQSGNFSASSMSYDDLSFVRGSTNSMRSSIGRGSVSTSSSVDFGPRFHRQLSSRKSDIENYKTDLNVKHRRSGSSLSVGTSTLDSSEVSIVRVETDVADSASVGPQENPSENKTCIDNVVDHASFQKDEDLVKDTSALTSRTFEKVEGVEADTSDVSSCTSSRVEDLEMDTSALTGCTFEKVEDLEKDTSALTGCTFEKVEDLEKDTSALTRCTIEKVEDLENDTCTFEKIKDLEKDTSVLTTCTFEKSEDLENDTCVLTTCTFEKAEDVGKDTSALSTYTFDEDASLNPSLDSADGPEVQLDAILEKEPDHACLSSPDSETNISPLSESIIEELQDSTVRTAFDKDIATSATDFDTSNHSSSIIEELVVLVEGERGTKGRSMTLEEATDTILFCSSIIHNLAYEAATIAIEKETVPVNNDYFPLVPTVGKDNSGTKDILNKKASKRSSKAQKTKSKKTTEKDSTKADPNNTNTGEETELPKPRIVYPNNKENTMPPKLESKCNCIIM